MSGSSCTCGRWGPDVVDGSPTHSANVEGLWKAKVARLRGMGSRRLVNLVSMPVLSYRKGKGRLLGREFESGRPVLYLSGLQFYARQRVSFWFGLHNSYGFPVCEEKVVRCAVP